MLNENNVKEHLIEGLLEFSLAYGETVSIFSSVERQIRLWQMFCWMFHIVVSSLKIKAVSNKLVMEGRYYNQWNSILGFNCWDTSAQSTAFYMSD